MTTTERVPASFHRGGRYWLPLPIADRVRGAGDGRRHQAVATEGSAPTLFLRGLERTLRHRADLQRLRVERRIRPALRERLALEDRAGRLRLAIDEARSAIATARTEDPERDRVVTAVERAAGIAPEQASDRRVRERARRVAEHRRLLQPLSEELREVLTALEAIDARLAGEWAVHISAVRALEDLLDRRGFAYARAYVRAHRRASRPVERCTCDAVERWTGFSRAVVPPCPWVSEARAVRDRSVERPVPPVPSPLETEHR